MPFLPDAAMKRRRSAGSPPAGPMIAKGTPGAVVESPGGPVAMV